MPIFDYRCEGCGHEYEAIVRKHDAIPTCPECSDHVRQTKIFKSVGGRVNVPQDDYPKNNTDLANYLGNGKYVPGYRRD